MGEPVERRPYSLQDNSPSRHQNLTDDANGVRERCGSSTSFTTDDSGCFSLNLSSTSTSSSSSSNVNGPGVASSAGSSSGHLQFMAEQQRSVRAFTTHDEFEWAMREDLAEWLLNLYPLCHISAEFFFEAFDDGILLCTHATEVQKCGEEFVKGKPNREIPIKMGKNALVLPLKPPHLDRLAKPGAVSFRGRDNVANFLLWCQQLGMHATVLFETEDLIQRKHTRNIILCLLEIARVGAKFGMEVPELIHLEQEIDAEIALDEEEEARRRNYSDSAVSSEGIGHSSEGIQMDLEEEDEETEQEGGAVRSSTRNRSSRATNTSKEIPMKKKPVLVCDLKSLDEMVRDIVSACKCENIVFMKRLAEGKYLIGEKMTLIFVRILRNHVMVRVGGGWDTLNHFLEKHDPCRKRQHACHHHQHGQPQQVPSLENNSSLVTHFADQGNFREGQLKFTANRPLGQPASCAPPPPPLALGSSDNESRSRSSSSLASLSEETTPRDSFDGCSTPRNDTEVPTPNSMSTPRPSEDERNKPSSWILSNPTQPHQDPGSHNVATPRKLSTSSRTSSIESTKVSRQPQSCASASATKSPSPATFRARASITVSTTNSPPTKGLYQRRLSEQVKPSPSLGTTNPSISSTSLVKRTAVTPIRSSVGVAGTSSSSSVARKSQQKQEAASSASSARAITQRRRLSMQNLAEPSSSRISSARSTRSPSVCSEASSTHTQGMKSKIPIQRPRAQTTATASSNTPSPAPLRKSKPRSSSLLAVTISSSTPSKHPPPPSSSSLSSHHPPLPDLDSLPTSFLSAEEWVGRVTESLDIDSNLQ